MSEERIGDKFLRKLYGKTVNNGTQNIDREEIGKEIGVLDVQIDNLVDELTAEGYVETNSVHWSLIRNE
jgi:ribosomal protein S19E (S16A)